MNKSLIITAITFILLLSNISAYIPIIVPIYSDNSPASGQGSSCILPIEFAKEHNCDLRFYDKYTTNKLICGDYVLNGDCEGGYYNLREREWYENIEIVLIIAVILFCLGIAIAMSFGFKSLGESGRV